MQHAATSLDLSTLEGWAAHARAVEQQAARLVGGDPGDTDEQLARLEHTARHATVGQRAKAWDRRNIGTITAVDNANGTIDIAFTATRGRTAARTMGWGDVQIVVPGQPEPRPLTPTATATLDRLTSAARDGQGRWQQHLARHGVRPGDRHIYEHAAQLAVDRAAALLASNEPQWLT